MESAEDLSWELPWQPPIFHRKIHLLDTKNAGDFVVPEKKLNYTNILKEIPEGRRYEKSNTARLNAFFAYDFFKRGNCTFPKACPRVFDPVFLPEFCACALRQGLYDFLKHGREKKENSVFGEDIV